MKNSCSDYRTVIFLDTVNDLPKNLFRLREVRSLLISRTLWRSHEIKICRFYIYFGFWHSGLGLGSAKLCRHQFRDFNKQYDPQGYRNYLELKDKNRIHTVPPMCDALHHRIRYSGSRVNPYSR